MGARPSSFKGGGGFLKDVDVTLLSYEFTDEFNGKPFEPGKNKEGKPKFHSLFALMTFLVDGADTPITQYLFVGDADAVDISDDGKTLEPHEEDFQLGASAGFSKFIATLCKPVEDEANGFDESQLPEDAFNFEVIENQRMRVGQETRKDKSGKVRMRKVTKGKHAGKEFEETTTVVTKYYGPAEEQDEAPATKGGKKGATAAAGKKTSKPVEDDEPEAEDVNELAEATIKAILADNKGTIKKPKLRMQVISKLGAKHPQREEVLALAADDKFLKGLDGVTYSVKTQDITAE